MTLPFGTVRMSGLPPLIASSPQIEGQVRTLVESSPLPMVGTEGPAHVVRSVNPAFCQLVGRVAGAILGESLGGRTPDAPRQDDDEVVALLDRVYGTGTAEFGVDLARVFGGGTSQLACAVWPIAGTDKRPGGLLIMASVPNAEDPTQLDDPASADELRDANERLVLASLKADEQADLQIALRAKAEAALIVRDEFISVAAHELRTPVSGIKLSAELARHVLKAADPDIERIDRYLLGIVGGASRLELLISDLMDVSRMRSGELVLRVVPIDLAALVHAVARRYAESSSLHQVVTDLPPTPLLVDGDAMRLEQILDNLLSNSLKYSPAGGEIGVSLGQASDGVVLTVRDEGIGLSAGGQDRIFEPFGRADNARRRDLPGMGLGLHISRQIAEAHGGRMWAESDGEDLGMTVGVWLPSASGLAN